MTNHTSTKKDGIPSFLIKTYEMLECEQYNHLIRWTQNGQSFVVFNQQELALQVLPNFFKHRNYPSFLRQLNMYNFRKTKNEFGFSEFKHKWFRKGLRSLLKYIKRRNQEQQPENIDIEVKEGDVENCKSEHKEMNRTLRDILENQQQLQIEFNTALQQSTLIAGEAQNLNQQLKQMEMVTQKKFDRLAVIVSRIVSGIDNSDIQSKLNLLFTQALLGEDSASYSEIHSQPDLNNNNTLIPHRMEFQFFNRPNDMLLYSGNPSPYRNFEIPSPFYSMMCQQMQQNVLSNVLFDPQLYFQLNQLQQLQMAAQQQQLALPPSIPMHIGAPNFESSRLSSSRPSHINSPYHNREEQQQHIQEQKMK